MIYLQSRLRNGWKESMSIISSTYTQNSRRIGTANRISSLHNERTKIFVKEKKKLFYMNVKLQHHTMRRMYYISIWYITSDGSGGECARAPHEKKEIHITHTHIQRERARERKQRTNMDKWNLLFMSLIWSHAL